MISPTTRITKSGHGRLVAIPPKEGAFEVEFKIRIDTWLTEIRQGLPHVSRAHATVPLMKRLDGGDIPEGFYALHTGTETLRVQNLGVAWELLAER